MKNGAYKEDHITEQKSILRELLHSKEHNNVIGICSKALGEGFHITVVVDLIITENNSAIIQLNGVDTSGTMLKTSKLLLSAIEAVVPFRSPYKNPFLGKLDHYKP